MYSYEENREINDLVLNESVLISRMEQ